MPASAQLLLWAHTVASAASHSRLGCAGGCVCRELGSWQLQEHVRGGSRVGEGERCLHSICKSLNEKAASAVQPPTWGRLPTFLVGGCSKPGLLTDSFSRHNWVQLRQGNSSCRQAKREIRGSRSPGILGRQAWAWQEFQPCVLWRDNFHCFSLFQVLLTLPYSVSFPELIHCNLEPRHSLNQTLSSYELHP